MAKIKPITEKELIAAVNEEGLGIGHPFESAVSREQELEQGNSGDIEFANAIASISQEDPEIKQ